MIDLWALLILLGALALIGSVIYLAASLRAASRKIDRALAGIVREHKLGNHLRIQNTRGITQDSVSRAVLRRDLIDEKGEIQ